MKMCTCCPCYANTTTSTVDIPCNPALQANSATPTVYLSYNPALQNTVIHQTELMSEAKVSGLPTYEEAMVYKPSDEPSGKPPSNSDTIFHSPMQHI